MEFDCIAYDGPRRPQAFNIIAAWDLRPAEVTRSGPRGLDRQREVFMRAVVDQQALPKDVPAQQRLDPRSAQILHSEYFQVHRDESCLLPAQRDIDRVAIGQDRVPTRRCRMHELLAYRTEFKLIEYPPLQGRPAGPRVYQGAYADRKARRSHLGFARGPTNVQLDCRSDVELNECFRIGMARCRESAPLPARWPRSV